MFNAWPGSSPRRALLSLSLSLSVLCLCGKERTSMSAEEREHYIIAVLSIRYPKALNLAHARASADHAILETQKLS